MSGDLFDSGEPAVYRPCGRGPQGRRIHGNPSTVGHAGQGVLHCECGLQQAPNLHTDLTGQDLGTVL